MQTRGLRTPHCLPTCSTLYLLILVLKHLLSKVMLHYEATMGRHIKNNKIISVKGKIKQEKKTRNIEDISESEVLLSCV